MGWAVPVRIGRSGVCRALVSCARLYCTALCRALVSCARLYCAVLADQPVPAVPCHAIPQCSYVPSPVADRWPLGWLLSRCVMRVSGHNSCHQRACAQWPPRTAQQRPHAAFSGRYSGRPPGPPAAPIPVKAEAGAAAFPPRPARPAQGRGRRPAHTRSVAGAVLHGATGCGSVTRHDSPAESRQRQPTVAATVGGSVRCPGAGVASPLKPKLASAGLGSASPRQMPAAGGCRWGPLGMCGAGRRPHRRHGAAQSARGGTRGVTDNKWPVCGAQWRLADRLDGGKADKRLRR